MNVTREDIDALTAVLKVQVKKEDYTFKVKHQLEDYRKKSNLPGFRKGMVPLSVIEKQFGKGLLVEELNKTANRALYDFIGANKLDILGNPIPMENMPMVGSIDNPEDFEFAYEIGLVPSIEVDLKKQSSFMYTRVDIDNDLVGKQIDDLRRRYGKMRTVDVTGENDLVFVQFVELNDDKSIKENGVMNSSTISMDSITDETTRKTLLGSKKGDKMEVDPSLVSRGESDTASMLGLTEDDLSALDSPYQITVNEIRTMDLADLNQEFFDKIFGEGEVKSEEELNDRISKDLVGMFENDSDRLLTRDVYQSLLENTRVELPDGFLKRWLKVSSEDKLSDAQIDTEYDQYVKGLKWQLIQGQLFKTNNVLFDPKEALEFTKGLLINQYAQYGMPHPGEEELTKAAQGILSKKEEANGIYDRLAEVKLTDLFKNNLELKETKLKYDDFVALANS
jgi:trigger factor